MIVLGRAAVVRPILLLLAGYIALWRRVCRARDQPGSGYDQGWNENECATGEYVQRSLLFHGRTRREDNAPATQGDMQIKRLFTFVEPDARPTFPPLLAWGVILCHPAEVSRLTVGAVPSRASGFLGRGPVRADVRVLPWCGREELLSTDANCEG